MAEKRILVTGATGFLGSHLCRLLLAEGYQVRGMKRGDSRMDLVKDIQDRMEWLEGDILDVPFLEDATKDVDWVFHCAATISFDPKRAARMMDVNVTGTANVVNACLYHKSPRLIHVSSIAAIGRPENATHISEATKWQKSPLNSRYAQSKFKAEMEVWRGEAEGLDMAIVNPSVILGNGFWDKGSCRLFTRVRDGLSHYPTGATGFVDVRDVARAMLLLAESGKRAERYIINGADSSYKDFFKMAATELGVSPPKREAGPLLRGLAWRLEKVRCALTGKSPLITKETALLSSQRFTYDNTKSIQELGLSYRPLAETVKDACAALQGEE